MLNNISKQINADLQKEQDRKDFYELIHEDIEFNNFIDNTLLNLNENGVNNEMLKNEMPFLFIEDTVVDDELVTNLQNEIEYEDDFEKKPISDSDETTDLQEPKDFTDDFHTQVASDAETNTKLDDEVDYADNQKTPVNIDEFSNEAAELLFEMGDLIGALNLLEDECDGTLLKVDCSDEDETIKQADEAEVCDTEYPNKPEGVVMEVNEETDTENEDLEDLEEDFLSLFESSDEEDDEDEEDDDEDNSEDKKEENNDEEDLEDNSEDKKEENNDEEELKESFSILDMFG